MPWADEIPEWLFLFIGVSEIAGALGVFLPAVMRIQPKLTPVAALGLIIVMTLATLFHVSQDEYTLIGADFSWQQWLILSVGEGPKKKLLNHYKSTCFFRVSPDTFCHFTSFLIKYHFSSATLTTKRILNDLAHRHPVIYGNAIA